MKNFPYFFEKIEMDCVIHFVNQEFESWWMSVELVCYVKTKLLLFYKLYFFIRQHSLMNRPFYNISFQVMQHGKFRNLNSGNFSHWKHLEFWVNVFWYCFKVFKRYTFHYSMKSVPIPKIRALLKYRNCLIHGIVKVEWCWHLFLLWL